MKLSRGMLNIISSILKKNKKELRKHIKIFLNGLTNVLSCIAIMSVILAPCLLAAVNINGGKAPYKTSHVNHPVSIWTRTSQGNYLWVVAHAEELSRLYTLRTGKVHGCVKALDVLKDMTHYIPEGELTPFVNCARNLSKGIDFINETDVPLAYQLYLAGRWKTDIREPVFFRGE